MGFFQCFFPQNLINHITTPLFILNAAYDAWQVNSTAMLFLYYAAGTTCLYSFHAHFPSLFSFLCKKNYNFTLPSFLWRQIKCLVVVNTSKFHLSVLCHLIFYPKIYMADQVTDQGEQSSWLFVDCFTASILAVGTWLLLHIYDLD